MSKLEPLQQAAAPERRLQARRVASVLVALLLGTGIGFLVTPHVQRFLAAHSIETRVPGLDKAQVIVVRTPGGLLVAATLQRVEEFAWQSQYTCPLVDCSGLLKPTVSRVRVKVDYVYALPLAAEWSLQREADHYRLAVPALQLQVPVGFDTRTLELATTKGVLSPPAGPNRERLLRELGSELDRRGAQAHYIAEAEVHAAQTVREFAGKWMLEQGRKPDLPIHVDFEKRKPAPL